MPSIRAPALAAQSTPAQLKREQAVTRAASKARRKASNRDDPAVRRAMALAVLAAGRCSRCGAEPFGTLKLHAHLPKAAGKIHVADPRLFVTLCSPCHAQQTMRDQWPDRP